MTGMIHRSHALALTHSGTYCVNCNAGTTASATSLREPCPAAAPASPKEPEFVAPDNTIRKAHYGSGEQPWDIMITLGWAPAFAAGNGLKYVRRYKMKNGEDDLAKGRWYAARLHEMVHHGTDVGLAQAVLRDLMRTLTTEEKKLLWPEHAENFKD